MLHIHGVANLINAVLTTRKIRAAEDLVPHLQDALVEFSFLGWTFLYYSQKARLTAGKIGSDRNEGKVVNDYYLPKDIWEPYLAWMARRQAEAMDPRAR